MRRHLTARNVLGALLLVAALFASDIAADDGTCCNVSGSFTAGLFPGGDGDEGFFGLPVGVPGNAMIVLDNSGSMMEFPTPLPAAPNSGSGNCTDATWAARSADRTDTPYDNGTANTFTVDSPPWGLGKCTGNACIFKGSAYYKYEDWGDDYATQYPTGNAAPAAANNNLGGICYGATGTTCQTCLDNTGYYAYTTSGGTTRYLFRGNYLNAYPPKYVIARKVVKDLVSIDLAAPTDSDSVRYGLTIFLKNTNGNTGSSMGSDDGGQLVVPLGPNCDLAQSGFLSTSSTQVAAYKEARQLIVDSVNNPNLVSFGTNTPLGETLFNVGQYFSDTRGRATWPTTGAQGPVYDYAFGTGWTRSGFYENAAGAASAPWVGTGRQESVCWSCQQSSVVIVTDGAPTNDSNIPSNSTSSNHTIGPDTTKPASTTTNDFRRWNAASLTVPNCSGCTGYILQKVASFLHTNDLRPDLDNGRQTQTLTTYTISFGITDGSNADQLLDYTAQLGGGKYWNTASGDELHDALRMAVTDTIARANSFSVSNTNTLQTGNNNQLVLARFRKLLGPMWEGHVLRYKMFNEYVQGCDSTKNTVSQVMATCTKSNGTTVSINPNINGDEDCNGKAICDGLFILDADCDPIAEDENGDFRKATLNTTLHIYQTTTAADGATPFWDAGAALSYKTFPADYPVVALRNRSNSAFRSADPAAANKRRIYTVLDSNGDGKFTSTDALVEFTPANAATIAPYLELNGQRKLGSTTVNYCAYLLERIGLCGGDTGIACPVPDAVTHRVPTADETRCATQIINYVRGWDVLDDDNDGCAGPGNPSNATFCPGGTYNTTTHTYSGGADGEERVRGTWNGTDDSGVSGDHPNDSRAVPEFWKLGDVFHSSPVVVKPPVAEFVCDAALEPQCTAAIHSPPEFQYAVKLTPNDYDANGDGKIDAGEQSYTLWRTNPLVAQRQQIALVGANDGMLHAFDAGVRDTTKPADWLGNYQFTPGTAAEVWAFIPPDLLPKLKLAIDSHQYFVDGDTMVRDVWVDNNPRDGKREPTEFHTVAIVAERSGGVHYTALDVTDTVNPKLLWVFPPNCSSEQSVTAQTWTSFTPRAPPIGPVKLLTSDTTIDPLNRGFEERWVVMLNGGFDPQLARGRGVWMLDVWTGKTLWKYTDDDLKAAYGAKANMWPVAATVGLTDIGDSPAHLWDVDGFFDTANWGDMGGTLFVARFKVPGTVDATTGLVTNWYGARAFEEQRQGNDDQLFAGRTEFFHMTANALDLSTGVQHTYLGGGNRDELLQSGAACGPNNVLGCFQAGCSGSMTTTSTFSGCSVSNTVTASSGKMTFTTSNTCGSPHTCGSLNAQAVLSLNCGGSTGTNTASMTCDSTGTCSTRNTVAAASLFPTKLTTPTSRNRYYGIWSYGNARTFSSSATAATFDGRRLTDITYGASCTGTAGNACTLVDTTYAVVDGAGVVTCSNGASKCSAAPLDPGWMYEYGRVCPLGTGNCTDTLPWSDEKTASGQTIIDTCVDWNTFRPRGSSAAATTDPCASADTTKARNYTYLADFVKGVPQKGCGYPINSACNTVSEVARASQRSTIAPPPDPTGMLGIGMDGEVKAIGAQIEPGSTPAATSVGSKHDLQQPVYWLEVDPSLHSCRHVNPATCQ